ncbi:MAG: tetratricopeptide repeat protein, partial [Elusimicrobia bacterium]|nr:tetratricopeptide repeat protein [Elusimicrobiota bacterium]
QTPAKTVQRDTDKSRAFYSEGLSLYSQGKLKEASAAWEQAVKYDDTNVLARNAYNRAQIELKEK